MATARREFIEVLEARQGALGWQETGDPTGLAHHMESLKNAATWYIAAKMAVVFCEARAYALYWS